MRPGAKRRESQTPPGAPHHRAQGESSRFAAVSTFGDVDHSVASATDAYVSDMFQTDVNVEFATRECVHRWRYRAGAVRAHRCTEPRAGDRHQTVVLIFRAHRRRKRNSHRLQDPALPRRSSDVGVFAAGIVLDPGEGIRWDLADEA